MKQQYLDLGASSIEALVAALVFLDICNNSFDRLHSTEAFLLVPS